MTDDIEELRNKNFELVKKVQQISMLYSFANRSDHRLLKRVVNESIILLKKLSNNERNFSKYQKSAIHEQCDEIEKLLSQFGFDDGVILIERTKSKEWICFIDGYNGIKEVKDLDLVQALSNLKAKIIKYHKKTNKKSA